MQCSICLDVIEEKEIHLDCGHPFHATCIVKHLRRDNRCPNCRSAPDTDDDEVDDDNFMDVATAIAMDDVDMRKRLERHDRQESVVRGTRREIRGMKRKLRPLERAVQRQVDEMAKIMWHAHEERHHEILSELDALETRCASERRALRASKLEILHQTP